MVAQRYWEEHKADFVTSVQQVTTAAEMLDSYQRFLSEMKTHVLSCYRQNAVLQQLIALLFAEHEAGAEMLLTREEPAVTLTHSAPAEKQPLWQKVLLHPMALYALLLAGMLTSLFSGVKAWPCALFFAAAGGVAYLQQTAKPPVSAQYQAHAAFSPELAAAHMARQAQQLDAHVDDLQALMKELTLPSSGLSLDRDTLSLCQLVWAGAHQGYPAESMLFAAEQLLKQNDLEWGDFSEEARACYQVMPTRKSARVVYPALRRVSDGSLVCKGQYLEQA